MLALMDFVERRIVQAQRAGYFEDLPLRGRPIPDLDSERPEGWWAEEYIRRDRARQRVRDLERDVRRRKALLWQLDDHDDVRRGLLDLNVELTTANDQADRDDRAALIDVEAELRRWREHRRLTRWGRYL